MDARAQDGAQRGPLHRRSHKGGSHVCTESDRGESAMMLNGGGAKVVRKGRIPKIIKYHLEEQVRRWRVEERKDEDEIAALCVQVAPESGVTRQNVHSYLQRLSEPEKDEMG